jgi:hypothetical protein
MVFCGKYDRFYTACLKKCCRFPCCLINVQKEFLGFSLYFHSHICESVVLRVNECHYQIKGECYHLQNTLPLAHLLYDTSQFLVLPLGFVWSIIIFCHLCVDLPGGLLVFLLQNLVCISHPNEPHALTSHYLWYHHQNNVWWSSMVHCFLHSAVCFFLPVKTKYLP